LALRPHWHPASWVDSLAEGAYVDHAIPTSAFSYSLIPGSIQPATSATCRAAAARETNARSPRIIDFVSSCNCGDRRIAYRLRQECYGRQRPLLLYQLWWDGGRWPQRFTDL